MAFRSKVGRKTPEVELQEIDSLRELGHWARAVSAAQALTTPSGALPQVIQAESSLQAGKLEEAEQLLHSALQIDPQNEEAIALLGQTLYAKGNPVGALTYLEALSIPALSPRLQSPSEASTTPRPRLRRSKTPEPSPPSTSATSHHAAVLTSGILTCAKALDSLERPQEAADVLKSLLAAVPSDTDRASRASIQEAVLLLADLHCRMQQNHLAVEVYRDALLRAQPVLDRSASREVKKKLASLLLHGGVEAAPLQKEGVPQGVYSPETTLDEAILLLMQVQQEEWEAAVHEELVLALTLAGRFETLAEVLEDVRPGVFSRPERWYSLGLAHLAAGNGEKALTVLRMAAKETAGDAPLLIAAGRACAITGVPEEGVRYAEEAVKAAQGPYASLKGKALHVLGVNLGLQARESRSDSERSGLQNRAVEVLREAVSTEPGEFAPRYDLAVQLAEMRRIRQAMEQVGDALEAANGAHSDSWRLLALLLTSEQRYSAAEEVIAVALESGPGRGEQVGLLRTLASVQRAGGDRKQALNTLSRVLGLEKRRGGRAEPLVEAGLLSELAVVNVELKEWGNAEEFLKQAKAVEPYHGGAWYASGRMLEAQGKAQEATTAYETAAAADPANVRSLLRVALLHRQSPTAAPLVRSLLTQVLQQDPMNYEAWHGLGLTQKADGSLREAADSFQTAIVLQTTAPAAPFSSLPRALSK